MPTGYIEREYRVPTFHLIPPTVWKIRRRGAASGNDPVMRVWYYSTIHGRNVDRIKDRTR